MTSITIADALGEARHGHLGDERQGSAAASTRENLGEPPAEAQVPLPPGCGQAGQLRGVELLGDQGGSVVLFDDPVVPVLRHDALDLGEEMLDAWSDHEPRAVPP
jgi:hypothetical protein